MGSTNLLVNENGNEVERTEYFPFGQVQSGGSEKYGFTGKENDADTGLMYYGARYYSPEYRIFIQPDTMLPDPYNPQALNRYAYTLNNPVKYTDPDGHSAALELLLIGAAAIAVGILAAKTYSEYQMETSGQCSSIEAGIVGVIAGGSVVIAAGAGMLIAGAFEALGVGESAAVALGTATTIWTEPIIKEGANEMFGLETPDETSENTNAENNYDLLLGVGTAVILKKNVNVKTLSDEGNDAANTLLTFTGENGMAFMSDAAKNLDWTPPDNIVFDKPDNDAIITTQ
ncbi:hypothetical protein MMKA1_08890 [Methanococcus maripaludis KA1]|uniref:RHS repeat-associated core domain-containing protein n=1 Tax=Methanococcus maripaludis KA1 TaxID=637914 RepID=A0A2Z5PJN8_METMI|nr:RHS repeat-associated core domain-containing protein [Methanococcus maripaludis]BAP61006.1 hypothetical protein MMKA1_08890 [Methanococcus maripaludis KA1]